jgi:hypothetical protein
VLTKQSLTGVEKEGPKIIRLITSTGSHTAKDGVSVQALDYAKLRERLLARHQVLDLPVLPPLPPAQRAATQTK